MTMERWGMAASREMDELGSMRQSLALLRREWSVSRPDPPLSSPVPPVRHVVYLHGFSSSPASSKARRFAAELSRWGVGFSCPDLNLPAFETLTVTRMLGQARAAIEGAGPGPVALIGSSLGAFVAVHASDLDATGAVDRLVLLAPAFDFGGNRLAQLGDQGIDAWRKQGSLRVFHYGWNEPRDVGFELYEDAARYDAFALGDPKRTLIVHGSRDTSVNPATVTRWAQARHGVELRMVDDDHQLARSMDGIWAETERFLGLRHPS
jgi:pimeloyl-ACP methyl ester carboxylesterase